ncbi:hypothetical protein ON010_g6304 [Phytophthora cinnamomi]|nr:hypothetical protein ON010_g6304 [Phytophthora cinnamomi]
MEHALNEEMERVAEEERNLDVRILEITRLEARLHYALLEQQQKGFQEAQQAEAVSQTNGQTEREAVLDLREKVGAAIDGTCCHGLCLIWTH